MSDPLKQFQFWRHLLSTVVVAVGLGVAWAAASAWLGSMVISNILGGQDSARDYLAVSGSGAPYLTSYDSRRLDRELDGTPITRRRTSISPASLPGPSRPRRRWDAPIPWYYRLASATDGRAFPGSVTWYFVVDNDRRMHLAGYDDAARMIVGYIGRSGFRTTMPPVDEQFVLAGDYHYGQIVCENFHQPPGQLDRGRRDVVPWAAYFVDQGKLLEIDLRSRKVRTVLPGVEATGLAEIAYYEGSADELAALDRESETRPWPDPVRRLALRTSDSILLVNPRDGEQSEFALPEPFRKAAYVTAYSIAGRELLIMPDNPYGNYARRVVLSRVSPNGENLQETPVDLAGSPEPTDRSTAWHVAPVCPSPLFWTAGAVAESVRRADTGEQPSFSAALKAFTREVWPPFAVVVVISVLGAAYAFRRERAERRTHPLAWAIATLLVGPAMLAAYLIEHGRRALVECPECRQSVPAQRDGCAACKAPLPGPARLETEVFA